MGHCNELKAYKISGPTNKNNYKWGCYVQWECRLELIKREKTQNLKDGLRKCVATASTRAATIRSYAIIASSLLVVATPYF